MALTELQQKKFRIKKGPSKFDLMMSLFDTEICKIVTFQMESSASRVFMAPRVSVRIIQIRRVNYSDLDILDREGLEAVGANEFWKFEGRIPSSYDNLKLYQLRGMFSDSLRRGWLQLTKEF